MEYWIRFCFFAVALLHLLPALGVLGSKLLQSAYHIQIQGVDVLVLLQHRASLFGVIGIGCLIAMLHQHWRWPMAFVAMSSMLGFVVFAASAEVNAALQRVMWFDVAGVLVFSTGLIAMYMAKRQ